MTLQREREHLTKADQHIAASVQRVADQVLRIERMARRGEDTRTARAMLQTLEEALTTIRQHRQLILDAIARLAVL